MCRTLALKLNTGKHEIDELTKINGSLQLASVANGLLRQYLTFQQLQVWFLRLDLLGCHTRVLALQ